MQPNELTLERTSKISLAALFVLLILDAVFYKERAIFSDAAFRLFNLINHNGFDLPGNRYGAFVMQLLPYIARKLHASADTIIFCYSISYYLFYILVAALLVYRYKQYALANLMALFYFLFVTESFIWVSETYIGTAWLFLLLASIIHLGKTNAGTARHVITFSVLAFFTVFSHFVVIIPTVFLLIYFIIEKKNWPFSGKMSVLFFCLLLAVIGLKFFDTGGNPYDMNNLHDLTHFSIQDIIDSFGTPVTTQFFSKIIPLYWPAIIVFIAGIAVLIKEKQKWLATWTIISLIGYLIVMGLTFGDFDDNFVHFHVESEWACISIIVATAFVFSFLPKLSPTKASLILASIFIVRFIYIYVSLAPFSNRFEINENILSQMRKKSITKLALINNDTLFIANKHTWALPYETTIMSAIDGDRPRLTFFLVNSDLYAIHDMARNAKGFSDGYAPWQFNTLDNEYFQIDTTSTYKVMSYTELMR